LICVLEKELTRCYFIHIIWQPSGDKGILSTVDPDILWTDNWRLKASSPARNPLLLAWLYVIQSAGIN